jgi:hypothetical protein
VAAARFESMRARAGTLAPNVGGVLRDTTAFFRRGGSGEGEAILSEAQLRRYHERAAALAPAEVLDWLHHGHRSRAAAPDPPLAPDVDGTPAGPPAP